MLERGRDSAAPTGEGAVDTGGPWASGVSRQPPGTSGPDCGQTRRDDERPWKERVSPCPADSSPFLLCPDLKPVFVAHENPWFRVNSRGSYYTLEYERPQVVILPVLDNDSVVMVRVNRPLIDDYPLELPAGDSAPGETPRMAAAREFAEETGIHVDDPLRFVPQLPLSEMPGRMPVLLSVFRVDLERSEFDRRSRPDEDIFSVEALSFEEAARRIATGEIYLSSPAAIISRFIFSAGLDRSAPRREHL